MKLFSVFFAVLCSIPAVAGDGGVRFVVLGARTSGPVGGIFSDIIDQVSLLSPDLVMNVGNLIQAQVDDTTATKARWDEVLNTMSVLGCDFYLVPGSNDIIDENTRAIYEKKTGCKRYYSFDYGNCHFVVLDNSLSAWNQLEQVDVEQYDWFINDLEEHKDAGHIFILLHIPYYLNSLSTGQPSSFMEQCLKYRVRAVFNGGLGNYMYLNQDGVDYITVGSSGAAMQDNDAGKGNFHHFLYVTTRSDEYNIAVIKHGGVLYRNVFTSSDYYDVQRAQREVLSFSGTMVREGEKNVSKLCEMTVNNTAADSITDVLIWNFDSTRYRITPVAIPLALGPGEAANYRIEVQIADGSQLYPLPRCTFEYPYTFGKSCTLSSLLSVRRGKAIECVDSPPDIDGVLNDRAWKKLAPISHFSDDVGETSSMARTELYLGYDQSNVYVALRCSESDTASIRASVQERDGPVYSDDNVWFFFDTNNDQETYYQLIVNPHGVTFDRACSFAEGRVNTELEWNGHWEIMSGREQNAWTLEMRIPKNELAPYSDERWGFNFRRLQTSTASAAYWTLPFGHTPGNFGVIEFE